MEIEIINFFFCEMVITYNFFPKTRIQSDHLSAIAPILGELVQRIEKHAQPNAKIISNSPLPISNLITLVDAHYNSYQNVQIIRVRRDQTEYFLFAIPFTNINVFFY